MADSLPRSRRALLAAGVGGVAAWVAAAIGRVLPVRAAAGDPLILGATNDAGANQTVLNSSATGASFTLKTTRTFNGSTGIFGWAASTVNAVRGVYGKTDSPAGSGVQGRNDGLSHGTGAAVQAIGNMNHGLHATTASFEADAVRAEQLGGSGTAIRATLTGPTGQAIYAEALNVEEAAAAFGVFAVTEAPQGRAVMGYAASFDADNVGVYGISNSPTGTGVIGITNAGTGVEASSDDGTGLLAATVNGTALHAVASAGSGTTYALKAEAPSAAGYAGHFTGRVFTTAFYELQEIGDPAAPIADQARLFVRDNGSSKSQLCVRFASGAVQVIATEP